MRRLRSLGVPSPLAIAVGLTIFTMLLAWTATVPDDKGLIAYLPDIFGFWQKGIWTLLSFAMQMMLMLCLGYVLALSPIVDRAINRLVKLCASQHTAVLMICFSTLVVAFFNWGLGLIFGAIISRRFGESFSHRGIPFNYPLMGAAGYTGLMVWHGGLSGSAPLKVAEKGHFLAASMGVVPISETLFSPMNLSVTVTVLLVIPLFAWWMARRDAVCVVAESFFHHAAGQQGEETFRRQPVVLLFGLMMLLVAVVPLFTGDGAFYRGINPNFINLLLFALCLLAMGNFERFLKAVDEAIGSTSGIMIQFPLYAGIMGLMKYSGLMVLISQSFVEISTASTFPLLAFVSAGIVNIFVPSGGGQWAVQGPILVNAAQQLGVGTPKVVMSLAYGDQLTNMVQPFWALPLLGITALKPAQLLPYTIRFMGVAAVIYALALWFF